MINIPFNKPHLTGFETRYIEDAVNSGKISGNGKYTQMCHRYFEETYGFGKCLLTTSCTDALEMAAILINIKEGDEVIMPSYTFVSTANAFILRGAKIIFIDSSREHPGMDEKKIEGLITKKTRAIVPVHYAGVACDMDYIMEIAERFKIYVIEDAAQAIESYYTNSDGKKKPLGSIGHLAAFSFHETKNLISGEGGMLVVNDANLQSRSEIIWEKGTNRSSFFRGEVDKYGWVDIGSSFLPSEIIAAFLWAQLENIHKIQKQRIQIWEKYYEGVKSWANKYNIKLPYIPEYATNNGHIFYLIFPEEKYREETIKHLKEKNILSVFHYLSLHNSPYFKSSHDGRELEFSTKYSNNLLRLPLYFDLKTNELDYIISNLKQLEFV